MSHNEDAINSAAGGAPPKEPSPGDKKPSSSHKVTESVENDPSFGRSKAGEEYWPRKVEEEMEHAVDNVQKEVDEAEEEDDKERKKDQGKGSKL